jgi:hypothetical protein
MGCSCHIYLPTNVRIRDVADVVGILSGCEKTRTKGTGGSEWVEVKSVKVKHADHDAVANIMVTLDVASPAVKARNGDNQVMAFFSYECRGWFLLSGGSNPYWKAIGLALVDFFGGTVDFNDCDETDVDYEMPSRTADENAPEDGDAWFDFQTRKFALSPLTAEEYEF